MHCYLEHITDEIEPYSLDRINCFERPAAIVIDLIKKNGSVLYLLYLKFFQSYSLYGEESYETIISNLEEEIGIKRYTFKIEGNLTDKVIDLINQGHPVLVPGNLKALYYSEHYMVNPWKHMFLVKGYDDEKKIFRLLDGIHHGPASEQAKYYDTVIRMDDLEEVFAAYKEYDQEPEIIYYVGITPQMTELEILKNFILLLLTATKNRQYMEYKILENLQSDLILHNQKNDVNGIVNEILNIPKYRAIIIQQLIKIFNIFHYNTEELENARDELEKVWAKEATRNVKHLFQISEGREQKYYKPEKNEISEQKLIKEINNCLRYLAEYKTEKNEDESFFRFENNEDFLIEHKNDEFIFKFHTGKTYNTWISDECPKVRIFDNKIKTDRIFCSVKLKIMSESDTPGHHEGIYFITNQNHMYTVAINYLDQFIFDFIGKGNIFSKYLDTKLKEYNLYIHQNGETLSYGMIMGKKQLIELGTHQLNDGINKVGFFCKTWDDCRKFGVSFSDYVIQTSENISEITLLGTSKSRCEASIV